MLDVQVSGKSYEFFMYMPRIAVPFKYNLSFTKLSKTKLDFLLDTWWHRLVFVCKANKWFGKRVPDRNSNTARWRGKNTFPANSSKTLSGRKTLVCPFSVGLICEVCVTLSHDCNCCATSRFLASILRVHIWGRHLIYASSAAW